MSDPKRTEPAPAGTADLVALYNPRLTCAERDAFMRELERSWRESGVMVERTSAAVAARNAAEGELVVLRGLFARYEAALRCIAGPVGSPYPEWRQKRAREALDGE